MFGNWVMIVLCVDYLVDACVFVDVKVIRICCVSAVVSSVLLVSFGCKSVVRCVCA